MQFPYMLCKRCVQYSTAPLDEERGFSLAPILDPESVARDFAAAVNNKRWDAANNKPAQDGPFVAEYYDEFFFKYSTIAYSVAGNLRKTWLDFPALAKPRALGDQTFASVFGKEARIKTSWWFGYDANDPEYEIQHVDATRRFIIVEYRHWRLWGQNLDKGIPGEMDTGGRITCQLVLHRLSPRKNQIKVVRYWHEWVNPENDGNERRKAGVETTLNDLEQNNFSNLTLAPMRIQELPGICVYGPNEEIRTHLARKYLADKRDKIGTAIFVGRIAAYPFETQIQVSLRTGLHFPICIAELSELTGTSIEVQTLIEAGKIVAGLHPIGHLPTQFIHDLESFSSTFKLFPYRWPKSKNKDKAIGNEFYKSYGNALDEALKWSIGRKNEIETHLFRAFPWRRYEFLSPKEIACYEGVCSCYESPKNG